MVLPTGERWHNKLVRNAAPTVRDVGFEPQLCCFVALGLGEALNKGYEYLFIGLSRESRATVSTKGGAGPGTR